MKKIVISLGAAALTFAMTGTAFAAQVADRGGYNSVKNYKSTTVITSNEAVVSNIVGSTASTGGNSVGAFHGDVKGVVVTTGAANSSAVVQNTLNENVVTVNAPSCGCETIADDQAADRGGANKVKTKDDAAVASTNGASAMNVVAAGSTTGMNGVHTFHGDVKMIGLAAGTALGTTQVGTLANFNTVMVIR